MVHQNLAQYFIPPTGNDPGKIESRKKLMKVANQVLERLITDSSKHLEEMVRSMYEWKLALDYKSNTSILSRIAREFISLHAPGSDMFINSDGRYGLMIYKIISEIPSLHPEADSLMQNIYTSFGKNQVQLTDSATAKLLNKRAWYRYMFAYINYLNVKHSTDKVAYLKKAFDFSPDLIDQKSKPAYFYDAYFLTGDEVALDFKADYVAYLVNAAPGNAATLSLLLQTALSEPVYKKNLEEYYKKSNKGKETFAAYWIKSINDRAKPAPAYLVQLLDGKKFPDHDNAGKWTFIDFWATWCMPCRYEHPDLQQFYDSTIKNHSNKISLLTIACNDRREAVQAYLSENKYSFPVAMSDGKIEHLFPVDGCPSKFLITPQGNYIFIPYSYNWKNIVKEYFGL